MGVEEVLADIDADQDAAHGRTPGVRVGERRGPTAFLFHLVNAGSPPVTMRTGERRSRGGPNLLADCGSPDGQRSRSGMASSSTTQVSMGMEWMNERYQMAK